jgi:hypothetical protein
MDETLRTMVELNVSGRVLLLCNSLGIRDQAEIQNIKKRVTQEILTHMDQSGLDITALSGVLEERLRKLPDELRQPAPANRVEPKPPASISPAHIPATPPPQAKPAESPPGVAPKEQETPPQIKQRSRDMTVKLATERKPIQQLVTEDCVQLGLLDVERAHYLVRQFPGKEVRQAELEVVTELRNNLHQQVRRFIRKHGGGPWPSPIDQEELRLEISKTPTVRSVLFLTRQILREREEWLERSHKTLTGRLFGERLKIRRGEK